VKIRYRPQKDSSMVEVEVVRLILQNPNDNSTLLHVEDLGNMLMMKVQPIEIEREGDGDE